MLVEQPPRLLAAPGGVDPPAPGERRGAVAPEARVLLDGEGPDDRAEETILGDVRHPEGAERLRALAGDAAAAEAHLAPAGRAEAGDDLRQLLLPVPVHAGDPDDLPRAHAERHLAQRGSTFYVPLGIGAHLERWGVPAAQIEELEWWQERSVGGVRIVCTPTRHYSGRGLNNRSTTLWSSWSVIGPQHRFFYSGDTGYGKLFQDIGARLGPFHMAFVKIGAYGPGQAWTDIHMTPEEAVQVHRDVRAKRMFPVHWSTFNLAYHDWDEPIRRAAAEATRLNVELVTPRLGEVVDADRPFASTRWWESVR